MPVGGLEFLLLPQRVPATVKYLHAQQVLTTTNKGSVPRWLFDFRRTRVKTLKFTNEPAFSMQSTCGKKLEGRRILY